MNKSGAPPTGLNLNGISFLPPPSLTELFLFSRDLKHLQWGVVVETFHKTVVELAFNTAYDPFGVARDIASLGYCSSDHPIDVLNAAFLP